MTQSWLPTCKIESLRKRAAILSLIRRFFSERQVLEVETPSLSRHTVSDPYLYPLFTHNEPVRYLQTSPEYAMKRLIAAGSGDIFQICKAFRDDEIGRQHNPEFTILEWYRVDFDMQMLIDEVKQLLAQILPVLECEQKSYQHLFTIHCGVDPIHASLADIEEYCNQNGLSDYVNSHKQLLRDRYSKNRDTKQMLANNDSVDEVSTMLKDTLLNVLFNQCIEPNIGLEQPIVVTHFPKSQAALATIDESTGCANRFEVYYKQIELANGFNELTCAKTQKLRFEQDNLKRNLLGLPEVKIDIDFITCLEHGLPPCSGVALGVDRLVMLALGKTRISEVISFDYDNC